MTLPATGLAKEVKPAGLIVPPANIHALVSAIKTLAENIELRRVLAVGAREHAKKPCDKTIILRSLEHELIVLQAPNNIFHVQ